MIGKYRGHTENEVVYEIWQNGLQFGLLDRFKGENGFRKGLGKEWFERGLEIIERGGQCSELCFCSFRLGGHGVEPSFSCCARHVPKLHRKCVSEINNSKHVFCYVFRATIHSKYTAGASSCSLHWHRACGLDEV